MLFLNTQPPHSFFDLLNVRVLVRNMLRFGASYQPQF